MVYIILLIFLIPTIIYFIRYNFNRLIVDKEYGLDFDATIISIQSEPDNWGKHKHIKTIVTFSDNSEYHTHYAKIEPHLGYNRIIVDAETIETIKQKANVAHKKKVDKMNIF